MKFSQAYMKQPRLLFRGEGGLKIGLRKYPDDKKPIWLLYKALGTPDEDRACAPYLKTIGIKSWNEGIHSSVIK